MNLASSSSFVPSSSSSSTLPDPIDAAQLLVSSLLPQYTTGGNGIHGTNGNIMGGSNGSAPPVVHGVRTRTFRTKFLPEHVYEYYAKQTSVILQSLPPHHLRYRELPVEFIDIMPLDKQIKEEALQNTLNSIASQATTTGTYGYVTTVYKALSIDDGFAYAVRRIEGARSTVSMMDNVVNMWARVSHPSVISLRRAFSGNNVRNSLGMNSSNTLFVVHDYYPGAQTLREYFFENNHNNNTNGKSTRIMNTQGLVPEHLLWSYACQIISGLRTVHDGGLNFRGLRIEHVLITGRGRIRISGVGITDILEADSVKHAETGRLLDIQSVGSILLQLATRSLSVTANQNTITTAMDTVQRTYTASFHTFLVVLLTKTPTAEMACRLLAPQLVTELDTLYDHSDGLDQLLHREADNGRLLRLLLKLGFINERPEYEGDAAWAETGDRYILKLFRDFLFHQTTDDGRPVLNVAHIIDSLNRLDIGSSSKILLSSRDGASLLVSSYGEVRSAVNHAFDELRQAALRKDILGTNTGSTIPMNNMTGIGTNDTNTSSASSNENDNEWFRRPRIPAVVRARSFNSASSVRNNNNNRANLGIRGMINAANSVVNNGGGNIGFNPLATMGNMNSTLTTNGNNGGGGFLPTNPFSMLQGFANMGINNGLNMNNDGSINNGNNNTNGNYDNNNYDYDTTNGGYNGGGSNGSNEYIPDQLRYYGNNGSTNNDDNGGNGNGGYVTNANEYYPQGYDTMTTNDGNYYPTGDYTNTTNTGGLMTGQQEYYPTNNNMNTTYGNMATMDNNGGNNGNNNSTFNVGAREFRPNW